MQPFSASGMRQGGEIYFQLKATDALAMLADGKTIAFVLERADLEAWLEETFPFILAIYDAQADKAYWLYVQAYFEALSGFRIENIGSSITVQIPTKNVVNDVAVLQYITFLDRVKSQMLRIVHYEP